MLFPRLTILDQLWEGVEFDTDLSNLYILSVQHILESTGSLFEKLIQNGVSPDKIYLIGKIYSNHNDTYKKLRSFGINIYKNKKPERYGHIREYMKKDITGMVTEFLSKIPDECLNILVLDDGGLLIKSIPQSITQRHRVIAIEQTTFGLRYQENSRMPIIQVAKSAAKKYLEPKLIIRSLYFRIEKYLNSNTGLKNVGVVGAGNIGSEIIKYFSKRYSVNVYDIEDVKISKIDNLMTGAESAEKLVWMEQFVRSCDVCFYGDTRTDIKVRHHISEPVLK